MADLLTETCRVGWIWFTLFGSFAGFLLLAGEVADKAIRADKKRALSLRLRAYAAGVTGSEWIDSFCNSFDAVFGRSHLSIRCFSISLAVSLITFILMTAIVGNEWDIQFRLDLNFHEGTDEERSLTLVNLGPGSFWIAAIFINGIADYFSLLETRLLLGTKIAYRKKLIIDFIATVAITYVWVSLIFSWGGRSLLESFVGTFPLIFNWSEFRTGIAIVVTAFTTSIWLWLQGLSEFLVRTNRIVRKAIDWIEVDQRPFFSLSVVSALIVVGIAVVTFPIYFWTVAG